MSNSEPRVRLYQSALNGVRYVYGRPVLFDSDPAVLAKREAAKEKMLRGARS